MILRPATAADASAFENFDLGDVSTTHLAEVAEIVRELWPWSQDISALDFDRQVHVADEAGTVIGVVAHHLLAGESGRAITGHRYLMVTAIQAPYQRGGYATAILAALFEHLREGGVRSVEWWCIRPTGPRSSSAAAPSRWLTKPARRTASPISASCSGSDALSADLSAVCPRTGRNWAARKSTEQHAPCPEIGSDKDSRAPVGAGRRP